MRDIDTTNAILIAVASAVLQKEHHNFHAVTSTLRVDRGEVDALQGYTVMFSGHLIDHENDAIDAPGRAREYAVYLTTAGVSMSRLDWND